MNGKHDSTHSLTLHKLGFKMLIPRPIIYKGGNEPIHTNYRRIEGYSAQVLANQAT